MAELKPYKGGYYLWLYLPSTVAAGIFAALFALGTAYISWRLLKYRAWFCTIFVLGGLFEVVGYAARATARDKTDQLMPYVTQSTLILLAPALFAASVYMVLGRVILLARARSLSIIPVGWLTKIFVCGDILSFVVQGSGAGLMVKGGSMKTGENIILAGLFIQIIIFGVFAVTSAIFHSRLRRYRPTELLNKSSTQATMIMLYVISALIMIRSIFRVIEYIMGQDGYPLRHEWTLYVFDGVLMIGVVVTFAWRFPGDLQYKKGDDLEMETTTNDSSTGQVGRNEIIGK